MFTPRLTGLPKDPSMYTSTYQISDCPYEPGISDEKYNFLPSGLKLGCATE